MADASLEAQLGIDLQGSLEELDSLVESPVVATLTESILEI
jgi:hypothetical protein